MLSISNLQVTYDRAVEAVRDVSLDVGAGRIVALLGSNGAGKSTVLKAICGVLYPEEGEVTGGSIRYDNAPLADCKPHEIVQRGLVQVPEGRRLFATLTVEENLRMGGYVRPASDTAAAMARVFALFPAIEAHRHRTAGYLSGGQQQMVAIGRALMGEPRLLLLDEPSLGLAPLVIEEIFHAIRRLRDERGLTVLLVEQNAKLALSLADYGYIMESGRIVLDGTPERLLANDDVQQFYLGVHAGGERRSMREVKHLQAPQALAVMTGAITGGIIGTASQPLLQFRGVGKRFGGVEALSGIDLAVQRGQIFSVIGPNGAGKTTLFNMASCLLPPTTGRILLDGEDITGTPAHGLSKRGVARTFQNLAVFKHETVMDNILTGMHARLTTNIFEAAMFWGRARKAEIQAREEAEEIVEFLEIETVRDVPVGTLSYGLQKRVELGRALAMKPRLLLLDEMVSGMNQEETEDIARFILDIRDDRGVTVMMIEHEMGIVMDISDQVCVLNFGRQIGLGTPEQVAADPAVIAAYLGQAQAA